MDYSTKLPYHDGDELNRLLSFDDVTIRDAVEQLNMARGVPVLFLVNRSDGKLVGTVSDGDIRRAFVKGTQPSEKVRTIMARNPRFLKAGAKDEEVLEKLSRRYRYVPIIDGSSKPTGYYCHDDFKTIPVARPNLKHNELRYLTECIEDNWISSKGPFVKKFEESFAKFVGAKHALTVCNGTAALHLALEAAGIGPGDEVIVPSLTFIASANAVRYTGAEPVFVDSEWETWNNSPEEIESKITPKTKAIMPVHLFGQPSKMEEILEIAKKHHLIVIEDAAEAHGAVYKGRKVGSMGTAGCFSFFGNKIITTGEGGMVVTSDTAFYERALILRDHGMDPQRRYWHPVIGYNYRMTNIQAAIGFAQMERIDRILERKRQIALLYEEELSKCKYFEHPKRIEGFENVYWMYCVVIRQEFAKQINRDLVISQMQKLNIETRPFFYPAHSMPPYDNGSQFPVAESLSARGISLPSHHELTETEIKRICNSLISTVEKQLDLGPSTISAQLQPKQVL